MRQLLVIGAVVLSAALAFGSAVAAYRELEPFLALSGSPEKRLETLAASVVRPGLSYRSKQTVVNDCADAMTGLAILSVESEVAARVYDNCATIASDIVAENPTFSYAWYVLALSVRDASQSKQFQNAILQAHRSSPNQEGLTYYRALLAYSRWSWLEADAQSELTADLAVIATSARGRNWLARRYLADSDFKQTIIAALDKAPANVQRSFLSEVAAVGG